MPKAATPAQPKKSEPKAAKVSAEKKYPVVEVVIMDDGTGPGHAPKMDSATAKELLGWEEEQGDVKFDRNFDLIDETDKKVRLTNNTKNRGFQPPLAQTYAQEMLRGNWVLNGETVIVSDDGEVHSGQHRLAGVVFAEQTRAADPTKYPQWDGEVRIEMAVFTGVSSADRVINTLDTGRPRTLADVIYRSEYFQKLKKQDRLRAAKATEYAVRFLWQRTAAGLTKGGDRIVQTHAESMAFLADHPRILKAVRHVIEEDTGVPPDDGDATAEEPGMIGRYVGLGYAAALMYLFGSADSDGTKYRNKNKRSEKGLNWELWPRAEEFVTNLAGVPEFKGVRHAIAALGNPETGVGGSLNERVAVLVLAWTEFLNGNKLTVLTGKDPIPKSLRLKYDTDPTTKEVTGISAESDKSVGGIDLGSAAVQKEEESADPDVSEEEVETTKARIKAEKMAAKRDNPDDGDDASGEEADEDVVDPDDADDGE